MLQETTSTGLVNILLSSCCDNVRKMLKATENMKDKIYTLCTIEQSAQSADCAAHAVDH